MSILFNASSVFYVTPVYNHGDGSRSEMPSVSLFDQQGRLFAVFPSGDYPLEFWRDMMEQFPMLVNHLAMPLFLGVNEKSFFASDYQESFKAYDRKARAFNLKLHEVKK